MESAVGQVVKGLVRLRWANPVLDTDLLLLAELLEVYMSRFGAVLEMDLSHVVPDFAVATGREAGEGGVAASSAEVAPSRTEEQVFL